MRFDSSRCHLSFVVSIVLCLIVALFIGIVFGAAISWAYATVFSLVGNLRIDRSDEVDGPFLFLELKRDLPTITKKRYILLEVRDEDFTSRK